jgi:hypothetical protein
MLPAVLLRQYPRPGTGIFIFPEADAWREVGRLGLDINNESENGTLTFKMLAEHFRKAELKKSAGIGARANETIAINELLLDNWILPRWGSMLHSEIRPLMIEAWFEAIASNPRREEGEATLWNGHRL